MLLAALPVTKRPTRCRARAPCSAATPALPAPRHLLRRLPRCGSRGCRRCPGAGAVASPPRPSRAAPAELRSLCPLSSSGSCL